MRQLELMKSVLIETEIPIPFLPFFWFLQTLGCVIFTGVYSTIDAMSVRVEDVGMKNINLHSLHVSFFSGRTAWLVAS